MLAPGLWHKSLTEDVIMAACERHRTTLDNPGFCLICGNESEGVEPDARNYTCEACGAEQRPSRTWDLGNQQISITRAEVEELERLGYVGAPAAFDPSVIMSDWWYSRLTPKGLEFLTQQSS